MSESGYGTGLVGVDEVCHPVSSSYITHKWPQKNGELCAYWGQNKGRGEGRWLLPTEILTGSVVDLDVSHKRA